MKSYKFLLPLLALLLLFSAGSLLAAPSVYVQRTVETVNSLPSWDYGSPILYEPGVRGVKITNHFATKVYVRFRTSADVLLQEVQILPGDFALVDVLAGTAYVCVSSTPKGPTGVCDDRIEAGTGPGIPTLSEWAMIIFSLLLLGMMTWYVVKRRRTAQSMAI